MSDINIDSGAINKVISAIGNTEDNIKEAMKLLNQSLNELETPIKIKLGNSYVQNRTSLMKIGVNCTYASTGIVKNANTYGAYEGDQIDSSTENISEETKKFYWPYPDSTTGSEITKAGEDFFSALHKSGNGSYNENTGIYQVDGYTYDVKNGVLTYQDKSVCCGIYFPKNATNLNALNVTTLLFGDGETKYKCKYYALDENVEKVLGKDSISSLIVVPQSFNGKDNKDVNRYTENGMRDRIVDTTNFANAMIGENSNRSNAIVGYSSGGFSSLDIAATNGKDRYDTVVVLNSYLKADGVDNSVRGITPIKELANLENKEIIFIEAANDGKNNKCNYNGLKILSDNSKCDKVTFMTPDEILIGRAKECGYSTYLIDDSYKWLYHSSVDKLVRDSNIMDYLGSK